MMSGMELLHQALSDFLLQENIQGRLVLSPELGNIRAALYQMGAVNNEETGAAGECFLDILLSKQDFARIQKKFSVELVLESSELLESADDHTMSASNA